MNWGPVALEPVPSMELSGMDCGLVSCQNGLTTGVENGVGMVEAWSPMKEEEGEEEGEEECENGGHSCCCSLSLPNIMGGGATEWEWGNKLVEGGILIRGTSPCESHDEDRSSIASNSPAGSTSDCPATPSASSCLVTHCSTVVMAAHLVTSQTDGDACCVTGREAGTEVP